MIIISKNIKNPWKKMESSMGLLCLFLLFTSFWTSYYFQQTLHITGLSNPWLTFWVRQWIKQTTGKEWIKDGDKKDKYKVDSMYIFINTQLWKLLRNWRKESAWILLCVSYLVFCTSALGIALNDENEVALISLWDQPGEGHSILVVRAGFSFIFIRMH